MSSWSLVVVGAHCGGHFRLQVVVFIHGWSFALEGSQLCSLAAVFIVACCRQ